MCQNISNIINGLRIGYCDERSDYKEGDIYRPKGAIFINDISIESPAFSLHNVADLT